jgi:hypothetical protein
MDGRFRLARTILVVALILFAGNYGYGLAHEAAHAAVIETLGGHVYRIYVNVLGTDAYTEHTVLTNNADLVLVNLAGLFMTSLLAVVFAAAGQGLLAAFLAVRTSIYAINYAPGTDVSTIYTAIGNLSMALSLFIVAVNLACICYAATGKNVRIATKRFIGGLSSS